MRAYFFASRARKPSAFVQNTSAAIIVLLIFLLAMNGLAIYLRNKFETRW